MGSSGPSTPTPAWPRARDAIALILQQPALAKHPEEHHEILLGTSGLDPEAVAET
jgi:hypothetical protein